MYAADHKAGSMARPFSPHLYVCWRTYSNDRVPLVRLPDEPPHLPRIEGLGRCYAESRVAPFTFHLSPSCNSYGAFSISGNRDGLRLVAVVVYDFLARD